METYNFNTENRLVQAQKRVKSMKKFYVHATIYFLVNFFIIISCAVENIQNLLTSDPYMTAVFWGIGLFAHGLAVFGQDFFLGENWEQKEIEKILRK